MRDEERLTRNGISDEMGIFKETMHAHLAFFGEKKFYFWPGNGAA